MTSSPWQLELKQSVTNYLELFRLLNLDEKSIKLNPSHDFPLLVTRSFINRIKPNDPMDPLLLQILPSYKETINNKHCLFDPLQEEQVNNTPGLLHKYKGRVLILCTKSCFIRCRFCFRKNFPYSTNIASGQNLENIIKYIKQDPSIHEIILSGGDPLIAPNIYFKQLIEILEPISNITTFRIHSRAPIVMPSRLEPELINIFKNSRFNIVLVTHCNHPNEINDEVIEFFSYLKNSNITLLNQAVLLKNINDNANILADLSKKLFSIKILPYYLHLLDPVTGTNHFKVKLAHAKQIFTELQTMLPGYLVPRFVTEQPQALNKVLLFP